MVAQARMPESTEPAGAPSPGGERRFAVTGLDCAEEVTALKRSVGPVVGGDDRLGFDLLNGRMTIAAEAADVPDEAILEAVRRAGLSARRWHPGAAPAEPRLHRQAIAVAAAAACTLVGLVIELWQTGGNALVLFTGPAIPAPPAAIVAYAAAIAFVGRGIVVKAWSALKSLRADMNLLMTVAVAGAIVIGAWFEAASVTVLFALSLVLERRSIERARRAVGALLALAPPLARLRLADGSEREAPVETVAVGSRIVVRPGERIPLDGRIVAGETVVDQAPITGESVPVARGPGDPVYAGTVNGGGLIAVATTRAAEDTTLARIRRMVEAAHRRRAPVEQWVERFAAVYTPAVMVAAIVIAVVPPLAFGGAWPDWFYRALVLLVIACPCALVISTPVAVVAALAAAARNGVLVKGGRFIELPARLRSMAFDKTGTLTAGAPEVIAVAPLREHEEASLLASAAALEAASNHPLAAAILAHAKARGIAPAPASEVQALIGKGVTGRVDGRPFWLGSHRYMEARGVEDAATHERAEALEREGASVVAIGTEDHVCGLIAVADRPRAEAAPTLARLHALGIRPLVMLTGDNRTTAEVIARAVGVDEVRAELLPEEKARVVAELAGEGVAMVGDGINDAPAMAHADVGIAMAAMGSDAAIETADIALMTDDLAKLPWLIGHSRRALAIIRQNVSLSLAVKAVFVVLTFAGYATLWGAIAADVGASLVVVANALRLARVRA